MQSQRSLKEIFKEYVEQGGAADIFDAALSHHIVLKKDTRALTVTAELERYISAKNIAKLSHGLVDFYHFNSVNILPRYSESELTPENITDSLMLMENRAVFGCLADAEISLADNTVVFKSHHSLAAINCDDIAGFLSFTFGGRLKVEFECDCNTDIKAEIEKELSEYKISAKELEVLPSLKTEKKPQKSGYNRFREKKTVTEATVYGYNTQMLPTPIKELDFEATNICFEGTVFGYNKDENRVTKDGRRMIILFNVTDYTGSLKVKIFDYADKLEEVPLRLKNGMHVKVMGSLEYDQFKRMNLIKPLCIEETEPPKKTDNATDKRIELHCHTNMSSMDAIASAEELVKRALDYGHKAIAITDHGVVQSFPDAMKAAKGKDIKIIYGMEGYLVEDNFKELREKKQKVSYSHIIFLVKNAAGLKNLYKMVSESCVDNLYKARPMVTRSMVEKYREGIIIGSACSEGELYKMILDGKTDEEIIEAIKMYDYLEVQPIKNDYYLIRGDRQKLSGEDALRDIVRRIIRIAKNTGRLFVATGDVHFLNERDEIFRRVIMGGLGFSDADSQPPLYYRTTDEMLAEFDYLDKDDAYDAVIGNPAKIAEMIEVIKPISDEFCPPVIENSEEQLKELTYNKAYEIYGDPLPDIVKARIEKELNSICSNGFSVMYMIAQKLVYKSLSDGYLVGSRGSVGSSFVAYLSGITEVNSLKAHYVCPKCKYSDFEPKTACGVGVDMPEADCPVCGERMKKDGWDIPFETFLGFDGDKTPDIDLNFSGEYQPVAHKFVEELFGEGHVFRAGTIGSLADKTAFGFAKKYFEERNMNVSTVEVERVASGCLGVKRTTGQHPGGVIVVPRDREITDFCPIQHPADDADNPILTTHFDYHKIDQNLLKLDILGHDDPTMIRMLEDITGIDATKIPIYDEGVLSLFTSNKALKYVKELPESVTDKTGALLIPEFGTEFVRGMLADTKPTTIEELIRISGLSHGTDVWLGNAKDLITSGTATLKEAVCTRDDIMIYLISKGLPPKSSFVIMEAVRKGKGLKPEWEELMREHSVPEWYIDSCKKIKYMFPKAHAVAYVTMALRIAYFKVYYPLQFYATYFSVRGDYFDSAIMAKGEDTVLAKIAEIKANPEASAKDKDSITVMDAAVEMYRRGFDFAPIDLYESDATKFKVIDDKRLLPPLSSLAGVGENAAVQIAKERANGEFTTIESFRVRTGVNKTVTEALINEGVFKDTPESSQLSFF
ncbi:MAG: PolC-type DNA polymerase III [Clostridia bacterium]|nr:PolC-type DNA polymerase III [Clostridia bacterium]